MNFTMIPEACGQIVGCVFVRVSIEKCYDINITTDRLVGEQSVNDIIDFINHVFNVDDSMNVNIKDFLLSNLMYL